MSYVSARLLEVQRHVTGHYYIFRMKFEIFKGGKRTKDIVHTSQKISVEEVYHNEWLAYPEAHFAKNRKRAILEYRKENGMKVTRNY